jgi:hypothetical protein
VRLTYADGVRNGVRRDYAPGSSTVMFVFV